MEEDEETEDEETEDEETEDEETEDDKERWMRLLKRMRRRSMLGRLRRIIQEIRFSRLRCRRCIQRTIQVIISSLFYSVHVNI